MEKIEPNVGNESPVRRILFLALGAVNVAIGCWAIWAGINDSAPLFALFDDPIPSHASFVPVFSLHLIVTGALVVLLALGLLAVKNFAFWPGMLLLIPLVGLWPGLLLLPLLLDDNGFIFVGAWIPALMAILPTIQFGLSGKANPYPRGVAVPDRQQWAVKEIIKVMPLMVVLSAVFALGSVYYASVIPVLISGANLGHDFTRLFLETSILMTWIVALSFGALFVLMYPIIVGLIGYNSWLARRFGVGEYLNTLNETDASGDPKPLEFGQLKGRIVRLTRTGQVLVFAPIAIMLILLLVVVFPWAELVLEGTLIQMHFERLFESLEALTVPAGE